MVSRGCPLVEAKHARDLVELLNDAAPAVARRQCLVPDERPDSLDDLSDRQQTLHARQVSAPLTDAVLEHLQTIEIIARVPGKAADRTAWLTEAELWVLQN